MKIGAHPMVVAVALGLLGPDVLREDAERPSRCATCDCGAEPVSSCEELPSDEEEALLALAEELDHRGEALHGLGRLVQVDPTAAIAAEPPSPLVAVLSV